jgi:1,2-phenylacetyl-CoA epoxidase PaaB subunit
MALVLIDKRERFDWEVRVQEILGSVLEREFTVPTTDINRALTLAESVLKRRPPGRVIVTIRNKP